MNVSARASGIKGGEEKVSAAIPHNQHITYRADIDGLRAFAVLAVVIFHAFPSTLRGGFVGVDIFFVISGYLISSIIFKSLDKGGFSFTEFYARRIRRIFPALILVLISCLIVGWFSLMAVEYQSLGKHVAAGLGFVQNIILFGESGYFDTASELKPLLHLWSLGIEEQFYLVFPVLALLLWRVRSFALYFLLLVVLLSFSLSVYEVRVSPEAAFYLPAGRAWELLVGSLLAYESLYNKVGLARIGGKLALSNSSIGYISKIVRDLGSLLGFLLLVASLVTIYKGRPFPGSWALAPVIGSALIILSGPSAWLNRHLFSSRAMVWLGLISYPLYLWHWPILSFLKIISADTPSQTDILLAVLLSVVLAWLTYILIEKRFRGGMPKVGGSISLVVLSLLLACAGYTVYSKNGYPFRMADRESFAQYYENSLPGWSYFERMGIFQKYRTDCDFFDLESYRARHQTDKPLAGISESCYTPNSKTSVMIWGDSHAQQLYFGVRRSLPNDISVLQVAGAGCMARIPGGDVAIKEYCRKSNEFALRTIKLVKPAVVIIAQVSNLDKDNDLKFIAAELKSDGVEHVLVLGPVPQYDPELYKLLLRKYWEGMPRRISTNFVPDVLSVDERLKQQYGSGSGGFDYLSARDAFCNEEGCLTYLGKDRMLGLVTFDYGHLTPIASLFLAQNVIAPYVLKKLNKSPAAGKFDPESIGSIKID